MEKCIACGLCAEKCPKKVTDAYDSGLKKRKAIYVKYAQAVPLKYAIDSDNCIFFQKGKCKNCEKVCPTGAIRYDEKASELTLNVGSVIISSGCEAYDPSTHDVYGYQRSPNVVTSLEFERILSASGPYGGHLIRPSDHKEPKKIAWLQCIGSRDVHIGARGYCSSVCCTYAIKEAMLAKEHSKDGLDAAIFYMDIRTHGKDFERYYNRGRDVSGIRFVKSRITNVVPVDNGENLLIRYVDSTGKRVEEKFDIVVLSVGLGVSREARVLAERLDIQTDAYGFTRTSGFDPVRSSVPGIYVCGGFEAPMDIPSSVVESSAAAGAASSSLTDARWSLTKTKEIPKETDIRGEPPRIGVFICRCGTNIASVVDVPAVVEYAKTLPYVIHAEESMFSCSQDNQDMMSKVIREKQLNRVVVSACTPKTHEPLFQETVINAGINKYLFEMANIRNQCSWVHGQTKEAATEKARDLTRMAVSKVGLLQPLTEPELSINPTALIIGGGVAGLTAAKSLSAQGYRSFIVEQSDRLGGQALSLHETWEGGDVQAFLHQLIADVTADKNIDVRLNTDIRKVDGFVGNFKTTVASGGAEEVLEHGVALIASGASELKPDLYFYGKDPRVITSLELDRKLIQADASLKSVNTALFIQCVGSRIPERPYCSKVCCTHSIKNALALKSLRPETDVIVLYRDMRSYGLREDLYRKAREAGIIFLKYDEATGLDVHQNGNSLEVIFKDTALRRNMVVKPDLMVLAAAMTPPAENPLAQMFKVTLNDDGFFMEAHVKLRPVDCATDGVFICGLAHAPKPIDESITQAQAAATRAVTLLAKKTIRMAGTVAETDPAICSSCGVCVSVCPYSAPSFIAADARMHAGKAQINPVLCKGCGLCVASCRSGAIHLKGFDNDQIFAQIFDLNEAA
ncbi:MAG: CoB--CoM heterodisulfide reductase iron-sulfur subunit A family protein [Desulfobacteraceae bacterium]|nr:MAG: CoB--CoM heterodisulfide reductase iron-sulfur subunit A family protein [Desulfobacteraceae bacterium]